MTGQWQHFPHEADIGVRGCGSDLAEAFAQTATAMMAVVTNLETIEDKISVRIQCQASDAELLLVDWLNALIYEMATRNLIFGYFDVTIDSDFHLNAVAYGEEIDVYRHHPTVEIKGATYTALRVDQENHRWCAQTVVDV